MSIVVMFGGMAVVAGVIESFQNLRHFIHDMKDRHQKCKEYNERRYRMCNRLMG